MAQRFSFGFPFATTPKGEHPYKTDHRFLHGEDLRFTVVSALWLVVQPKLRPWKRETAGNHDEREFSGMGIGDMEVISHLDSISIHTSKHHTRNCPGMKVTNCAKAAV